ncbi:Ger(x)C family germination protein [Paenibacillus endophyticus]|uniref:Ger(X)C family germination protein n=1 Tax=Paenibacillus endophyticus TaxID=1294268 RepID=A0A7W5C340_9BACL|nr:Ger(x)C family spore germination protein [Paenibacillus endophyticus]MBB3150022.1 Ger(x)C family germination protein [Paenibacillus endophyticus]
MVKSLFRSIIPLTLCLVLTACGNEKLINEIMLVQTLGFDSIGSNVRGSILIGDYRKKGEVNAALLDTVTTSELDIIHALNAKAKSPLEYGQLGIIVFGNEYSRQGVDAVIENLCRDTRISTRMQLAVTDKSAYDLLHAAKKMKDAYMLSDMIEQSMDNGNLPSTNLQQALYSFYTNGRDLYLPHLTLERNELKADGVALFKDEKYVVQVGLEQSLLLKMLLENTKNGSYLVPDSIKNGNGGLTLLRILKSKTKYSLTKRPSKPLMTIELLINAEIRDVPNRAQYHASDLIPQFEHRIEAYIANEINKLLALCQKYETDPLGLEDIVIRNSQPPMDSSQGDISGFDTEVKVKLDIISQ